MIRLTKVRGGQNYENQALLFVTAFASGTLLPGRALANNFGPVSRDVRMLTDHVVPVQGGGGGGGGGGTLTGCGN